jgi:septum formation protein
MSGAGLILASASPRRLELLAQIGVVPTAVTAPAIDETPARDELPRLYAQRIARAKAVACAKPGDFVLAADTVVAVGRRILGKAEDEATARKCLILLSGRRHHVITCVVVQAPDGRTSERVVDSDVIFARLEQARIDAYLAGGEWHGKAGGYAIQGRAAAFVRSISGSYSGVVGLPLFETAQLLRGLGYKLP